MSGFEYIETGGAPIKAWTRGVSIEDAARRQIEDAGTVRPIGPIRLMAHCIRRRFIVWRFPWHWRKLLSATLAQADVRHQIGRISRRSQSHSSRRVLGILITGLLGRLIGGPVWRGIVNVWSRRKSRACLLRRGERGSSHVYQ